MPVYSWHGLTRILANRFFTGEMLLVLDDFDPEAVVWNVQVAIRVYRSVATLLFLPGEAKAVHRIASGFLVNVPVGFPA